MSPFARLSFQELCSGTMLLWVQAWLVGPDALVLPRLCLGVAIRGRGLGWDVWRVLSLNRVTSAGEGKQLYLMSRNMAKYTQERLPACLRGETGKAG